MDQEVVLYRYEVKKIKINTTNYKI